MLGKMSRDNTKARDLILEKDLAKNVLLSSHHSFCLNRSPRRRNYLVNQEDYKSNENECGPMNI